MVVNTAGRRAFTDSTLDDPAISDMRRRVRLVPYPDLRPWPNDRPARVPGGSGWRGVVRGLRERAGRSGSAVRRRDLTATSCETTPAKTFFDPSPILLWQVVHVDDRTNPAQRLWPGGVRRGHELGTSSQVSSGAVA